MGEPIPEAAAAHIDSSPQPIGFDSGKGVTRSSTARVIEKAGPVSTNVLQRAQRPGRSRVIGWLWYDPRLRAGWATAAPRASTAAT